MATAYTAPSYNSPPVAHQLGPTTLLIDAYGGDIGAKLTVINDTMLLARVPSLSRIAGGWMAVEDIDTHASAPTSDLALTITDGTLSYTLLASISNGNSGAQAHSFFTELTNALGTKLVNTNANRWDLKVSATAGAATAGTAGILRVRLDYLCDEAYGA